MREKIYKQKTQSVFDGYPMDNINVYFYVLLCASTYFYFLMQLITRRYHGATCSLGSLGSERVERVDGHWVHRGIPGDLR